MAYRVAAVLAILASATVLPIAGCDSAPTEMHLAGPTMGTTYTVRTVAAPPNIDSHAVRVAVEAVLEHVDRSMSGYRPDSEVSRFNAATTTDWYPVSPDLAAVVQIALEISAASGGAFDVTVAPLVSAWGFGAASSTTATLPDAAQLARLAARVGYAKLHVRADPPALRKEIAELTVDLNGIAPGFAVDQIATRLRALAIERFMIDIGGEIRTQGHNARNGPWRIAVERPAEGPSVPHAFLELRTAAVTTSGEYRHYVRRGGERYSHTIDPRSGRPLRHALGSVVVIGDQAAPIDAWATALNVLGLEAGYELAARRGLAAMFIEQSAGQWQSRATPQFERYLASE